MLRKSMPTAELILWSKLKNKQLLGHKFRRQYGVESYSVDFYCPKVKLALELDGDSHYNEGSEEEDRERHNFIERYGITILRFTNDDVKRNLHGVMLAIEEKINELEKS